MFAAPSLLKMAAQEEMEQHEEMMAEEADTGVNSIEALVNYGVNAGDIAKLRANGIHTIEGLAFATKKELVDIKGISDQKVDKMQKEGKYGAYAREGRWQFAPLHCPRLSASCLLCGARKPQPCGS